VAPPPTPRGASRPSRRDRHGRGPRSSLAGPLLPFLRTRSSDFDDLVAATVEHLRGTWPDDLEGVSVEVAPLPDLPEATSVPRWSVDAAERRVVLYRLPIERLGAAREHRDETDDEWRHRAAVEGHVLRAVGELLGRDPWDLSDRWRDD